VVDNILSNSISNRDLLREVTINIVLERINIQEGIIIEVLLDSSATGLIISFEFCKKVEV